MKTDYKILLISLIIITIICSNTINAEQINNNTDKKEEIIHEENIKESSSIDYTYKQKYKTTKKTNTKSLKTDTIQIDNVSTYKELTTSISKAKRSDAGNYVINLKKGDYNITQKISWGNINGNVKTLTINGENSTINGNNIKTFLSISQNTTVHLNNLTITNTTNTKAGAILNQGTLTLNNSAIINSISTDEKTMGGIIYNIGNLNIYHCLFENNTANHYGGVIYNQNSSNTLGQIYIENSTFNNNNAVTGSSIYCFSSNLVRINNSKFMNNKANDTDLYFNNTNCILIENSLIENNSIKNNLITTFSNAELNNITIKNNQVNGSLIKYENNLTLNNSLLENNTSNYIINHKLINNRLTIDNSTFKNNIINNSGIYTINNSISIKNSLFYNNTIKNESLIFSKDANTTVMSTKFYNNTALNLFNGNNFEIVKDNKYLGNMLRNTHIIANTTSCYTNPLNITIYGKITTNPIYNTTISTGNVIIKEENKVLANLKVSNGTFNTSILFNNTYTNISIIYNGETDYINANNNLPINIQLPKYTMDLIVNDSYNYGDVIKYIIVLKNTGNITGSNIKINNMMPSNLKYLNSTENYNQANNTWTVNKLYSNETKFITVNAIATNTTDIILKVNMVNQYNKTENITKNHTILFLEPDYNLNIKINNTKRNYGSNLSYTIVLENKGKGRGSNITMSYQLTNNNNIIKEYQWNISNLNSNETKKIYFNDTTTCYGLIKEMVIVKDSLGLTINKTLNYTILKPYMTINNKSACYHDIINISARINNFESIDTDKIIFRVNNEIITGHKIICNNTITLLNYKIDDSTPNKSCLEVIYFDKGLNFTLRNSSILRLNKLNVISYMSNVTAYAGKIVNLTVKLKDENNNSITDGKIVFKINGKTIRDNNNNIIYTKITNSQATLTYKIPTTYTKKQYTIQIIYSGTNTYTSNRNTTYLTLKKLNVISYMSNITAYAGKTVNLTVKLKDENNNNITDGKIVFKINGKTIRDNNNNIIYTKITNSQATLTYKIPTTYTKKQYTIQIIYSGTNTYTSNRNSTYLLLSQNKNDSKITIKKSNLLLKPLEN